MQTTKSSLNGSLTAYYRHPSLFSEKRRSPRTRLAMVAGIPRMPILATLVKVIGEPRSRPRDGVCAVGIVRSTWTLILLAVQLAGKVPKGKGRMGGSSSRT
jgi:hypothetical protein